MPRRMLEDLENEIVELKVTLSYFIDPNPGLSASVDPQRYQSHGLRFDLRRKNEDLNVFKQRVNASERDNPRVGPQGEADDTRWLLGPQSVASGSLHCDVWTGPAIELAGRDTLCIKPVVGWCRSRAAREVCNATRRYSLIVSLKAHNIDVDLYTPVSAAVDVLLGCRYEFRSALSPFLTDPCPKCRSRMAARGGNVVSPIRRWTPSELQTFGCPAGEVLIAETVIEMRQDL